jgi:two-component system response regulator AtoC
MIAGTSVRTVLVAVKDRSVAASVSEVLGRYGYAVKAVHDSAALSDARRSHFDCVAIDSNFCDAGLAGTVRELISDRADMKVVVLARTPSVSGAAEAFAAGAGDYVAWTAPPETIPAAFDRVFRHDAGDDTPVPPRNGNREIGLIGMSPRMVEVYKVVARVANLASTVLITGETGSGKEQIARAIHGNSRRAAEPFIAIDCASVPEGLFESEFFGHEKGSFTGAHAVRKGVLEAAGQGTCFLDEIGELPLHLQAKLLRALQEKTVRRVGSSQAIPIAARIICATNRDLADFVHRGTFREDLYYRLNVVPIHLPPLRDRPDDIRALIEHFVERFSAGRDLPCRVAPDALHILLRYPWPGNVRQLENVMERTVALTPYPVILPEDLPAEIAEASRIAEQIGLSQSAEKAPPVALRELNRRHIEAVLEKTGGNKLRAAQMLGIDRRTLYRILERSKTSNESPPHP